ncbi:type II secretion system F family protein [Halodurantibacterium flavum]|uniref:Type II secretion system F family protein n=1 Tax=Halodurantibacterium flavum TaxID=1382802 RepID=A0ABW4S649_9RHOB
MSAVLLPLLTALAAALAGGFAMTAILYPRLRQAHALRRRVDRIAASGAEIAASPQDEDARRRQLAVEKSLRQLEEKRSDHARQNGRLTLGQRLQQADLDWTRQTYLIVSLGAGVVSALLLYLSGLPGVVALPGGMLGGWRLPVIYVNRRRNSRFRKFTAGFPGAIDVIVRGIRAGLPLADCMKIIAAEAPEPIRSEFRTVVEEQMLGMPMPDAVQRLADRLPLTEARFFAIVITIQYRTGGSLSEALGNLARVLRERRKMQEKIKAMSAEAKASGGIIGALPVVVAFVVWLTSPDYISLLATTFTGNAVLVASGLWMLMGVLVMRKMINFDF